MTRLLLGRGVIQLKTTMPSIQSLFESFYQNAVRQEAEGAFFVRKGDLTNLRESGAVYRCNEMEFNQLVAICREITKTNPAAISLDADTSFADPPEKRIGRHNFEAALLLNSDQVLELATRCMPPT